MTGFADMVTTDDRDISRMTRVLDAAAELLVRQGYRRVTVEDVARRAGIGKGTVYLHFRTKDALFLTVLLRSQRSLYADLADRIVVDPPLLLPWRMTGWLYDRMRADEVTRALYLGDPEVLGRLAHEAAGALGELATRRFDAVRGHFALVREARLVTDDLPVDEQIHSWGAIAYGFFATAAMPRDIDPFAPADAERRAELLEHALERLLAGPAPKRAADGIAPDVAGLYRPLINHIDTEWHRRCR